MADKEKAAAMKTLRQMVTDSKFAIFRAQDSAPLCLGGGDLDGVTFTLVQMRSSLEQLDNRIQAILIRDGGI